VDARSSLIASIVQRMPEWLDKGLVNFHAVLETPKGNAHPRFAHLPEFETFAKSNRERNVLALYHAISPGRLGHRLAVKHAARSSRDLAGRHAQSSAAKTSIMKYHIRKIISCALENGFRPCPAS
jgi:hypothetical protein